MGIIYIATSPSGKSYVGQTIYDVHSRWRDHVYDAFDPKKDHCKLLNRAIRKYGADKFTLNVICECDNSLLNEKEAHYISQYDTVKPKGYNLTYGGSSKVHIDETKEKISASLKGRKKSLTTLLRRSQTRKSNKELPMYVIEAKKNGQFQGYRVTIPGCPEKRFCSKENAAEQNLQLAIEYVSSFMAAVQRSDGSGSIESSQLA